MKKLHVCDMIRRSMGVEFVGVVKNKIDAVVSGKSVPLLQL